MRDRIDILFIHVPKYSSFYKPFGDYMTINLLPMGTLALADRAARKGYKTEVIHLGVEWIHGRGFSPMGYLGGKEVRVAALPLHWHQQSYDVLKAAEEIGRERPETFIVLGGYTASLFHKDILTGYPFVDAVIRGDAEVPLMSLIKAVEEGSGKEGIPNLTWRRGKEIKENAVTYVSSEADLDQSSYSNLGLLRGAPTYVRYMGIPFVWAKGLSKEENRKRFHLGHPVFSLNAGRGCTGNCTWCGGGARAQRVVNGRIGVVFRSPDKVADTAAEAAAAGYEMIHLAFDPGKEGMPYYLELFPLLRKRGVRARCYFESFSLPSRAFLAAFAETFVRDGSVVALSPESGDERIRDRNKSFSFSNHQLMETISTAEGLGIRVDVFFAMGIPGERYEDLGKTISLRREIKRRFSNIGRSWSSPISLEPGSPWHLEPEAFGIVSSRSAFDDFYRASSPVGGGLGYHIPDYLGDGRELGGEDFENLLKKAKCRDHCSLHPDPTMSSRPFWGRMYCRYLNWRVGGASG
jgi:radical SAM superfamily enzyme YgiQ (UPF0313 family)